jgi:Icc-related predicted phosphoesterase
MKIICMADLHRYLPPVPADGDLLLLGGDCLNDGAFNQARFLDTVFRKWLEGVAARMPVVATPGNHDWIFQTHPDLVPNDLPWTVLVDQEVTVGGLRIWGSPWQPPFFDWAFNLPESDLEQKWALIPEGIDILLLHGPPFGAGDLTPRGERVGSPSLTARILAVRPKLVVCGHIHSARGEYRLDTVPVINAAMTDERYFLVQVPPLTFDLEKEPEDAQVSLR